MRGRSGICGEVRRVDGNTEALHLLDELPRDAAAQPAVPPDEHQERPLVGHATRAQGSRHRQGQALTGSGWGGGCWKGGRWFPPSCTMPLLCISRNVRSASSMRSDMHHVVMRDVYSTTLGSTPASSMLRSTCGPP